MQESRARFSIGDVVAHRLFGYRGVVIDVDPVFGLSDEWYEQVAQSRPPRNAPWYHVIAEGSPAPRYVAERNLARDETGEPVRGDLLDAVFDGFEAGRYVKRAH